MNDCEKNKSDMNNHLQQNKENAIAYYRMAYEGNPREAAARYAGTDYIQHNPGVGNGTSYLAYATGIVLYLHEFSR